MTDIVVIKELSESKVIAIVEQGPAGPPGIAYITYAGGDVTGGGYTDTPVILNLNTTQVTAGTYGSSNQVSTFTVDSRGRLTSASSVNIQLNASAIVAGTLGTSFLPAFSGDVSSAEGTATLTLANSGITAGTYDKVTFNSKGIATSGSVVTTIADSGILDVYSKTEVDQAILAGTPSFLTLTNKPITLAGYGINDAYTKAETDALVGSTAVSWSTLTGKPNTIAGYNITDAVSTSMIGTDIASLVSGKIPSTQLPSYVDDVIEGFTLAAFPAIGEIGKIYVALDTNLTYRWSGSAYISMGGTTTDAAALVTGTLNAARLPALTGSDVSSTAGSGVLTLSPTTVTPGTYNSVTVDQKGRVTAGSNTSSYTLPSATTSTLGGVIVDGTTITVDPAGKITAVGGGGGGTGAFATFTIADGELSVEHLSSFTLSLVDGEFIAEYN